MRLYCVRIKRYGKEDGAQFLQITRMCDLSVSQFTFSSDGLGSKLSRKPDSKSSIQSKSIFYAWHLKGRRYVERGLAFDGTIGRAIVNFQRIYSTIKK